MRVHPQKKETVGVDDGEVPPVPIPNTEVKLISVENTWRATAWEDRAVPTQIQKSDSHFAGRFFVVHKILIKIVLDNENASL